MSTVIFIWCQADPDLCREEERLSANRVKYLELKGMFDSQLDEKHQAELHEQIEHQRDVAKMHQKWQAEEDTAKQLAAKQVADRKAFSRDLHELNRCLVPLSVNSHKLHLNTKFCYCRVMGMIAVTTICNFNTFILCCCKDPYIY